MSYNSLKQMSLGDFAISEELFEIAQQAKHIKVSSISQEPKLGIAQSYIHTDNGKLRLAVNTCGMLACPINSASDDALGVRGEGRLLLLISPNTPHSMLLEADDDSVTNYGKELNASTMACMLGLGTHQHTAVESYWDNVNGSITLLEGVGVFANGHGNLADISDDDTAIQATYYGQLLSHITSGLKLITEMYSA